MAITTQSLVSNIRVLANEYTKVYNRLMQLSSQFRAGMPAVSYEDLIPDSEVVKKIREAGDAASVALHRVLEVSMWLNTAADEYVALDKARREAKRASKY